ncbi:MAG: histidinol-phosphate transaminase [Bacteroidetes bacterium HGW-Bacteroidetes-8]|jgi:histidinol-phosphate aminotransferase|nr:MAG: histidinol-phosphate transaminase [Bacteroidetes bacterium HGW-Bacteroidetes-8]
MKETTKIKKSNELKEIIWLDNIIRPNIKELKPYSTARDESDLKCAVYLDANESPYNSGYNRYPDPHSKELKRAAAVSICKQVQIFIDSGVNPEHFMPKPENIFAGNGSDEAIDLLIRIFCIPGRDNIITLSPTYGMYKVCASINDISYRELSLETDFSFDRERLLKLSDKNSKIIFLCSPNNPTGNLLKKEDVIWVIERFGGVVVVDEAYIDFASDAGFVPMIDQYPNLVVLRTMSKAKGMAAIRVGFALSSPKIIAFMERVKYPYNISRVNQELAIRALKESDPTIVETIIAERDMLAASLGRSTGVERVYPSNSNFLLVKFTDAKKIYNKLLNAGIVTRDRSDVAGCSQTLRITVGKPLENRALLSVINGDSAKKFSDCIELSRVTKETKIQVRIYPDGGRDSEIRTGVGFFDHMLEQISVHSGISMDIDACGDLKVDPHHTVEDVAIVLGEAFKRMISAKKGYNRYGFVLPMDESRAEVLLDLGGRASFIWDVSFKGERVGEFPCEMFRHFFSTLSSSALVTLHISAQGDNDHHKGEAIFKAFARALRVALSNDVNLYQTPSSKGVI